MAALLPDVTGDFGFSCDDRMDILKQFLPRWCVTFVIAMVSLVAVASAQSSEPYKLAPEDVISVQVINHPEFSGDFLIPQSGTVMLPVVGDVWMTGKTLQEVRQIIVTGLKVRLLSPEVNIVLKVPHPRRIYAFGDLQRPGVLELIPGWRVQEALTAAGGVTVGVQTSDIRLSIERRSKDRIEMPLSQALNLPPDQQITLSEGDVLRFQATPLIPVYVSGKVKLPALYRLRDGEAGLLEAIAQAGGVADDANLTGVRITHLDGTEEKVDLTPALIDGQSLRLPRLRGGDLVIVPESQDRYVVQGYVVKPGYFAIPSGHTITLSQAVAIAGGSAPRGRLSRVAIVRMVNGKATVTLYDLGKFLTRGEAKGNPVIQPGDVIFVPETDKFDINQLLAPASIIRLFFGNLR